MSEKNKYVISTDSTADLPDEYCKNHALEVQYIKYDMEDIQYDSKNALPPDVFYSKMREGNDATTMALNPIDIKKAFLSYIEKGLDVLHISFSSALSSSYSNAVIVSRELMAEHPGSKIIVLDSLSASLGQGLLVHYALKRRDQGHTIEEVAEWVEFNKRRFCHQFTVDDLNHLHRGGRVSKATAVLGTLINVKPVLHVDNEGRLIPLINVRGRKKALIALVNNMETAWLPDENEIIFIGHADALQDAVFVKNLIHERFGIDNFLIDYISPTIGAHSGPGTIALFFIGNKR